jgi:hypothetical protein
MLGNPFVAALIGLLFAVGLLYTSRASFRAIRPESAPAGLGLAALSLFLRLALVTAALWVYKSYFTPGLKPFAFTLAGGFLVLYTVELVRFAGLRRYRRPHGVR